MRTGGSASSWTCLVASWVTPRDETKSGSDSDAVRLRSASSMLRTCSGCRREGAGVSCCASYGRASRRGRRARAHLDVELQSLERLDRDAVLLARASKHAAELAAEDARQGRLLGLGLCDKSMDKSSELCDGSARNSDRRKEEDAPSSSSRPDPCSRPRSTPRPRRRRPRFAPPWPCPSSPCAPAPRGSRAPPREASRGRSRGTPRRPPACRGAWRRTAGCAAARRGSASARAARASSPSRTR